MSDLSSSEKRRLELLFGMSSGYVMDFSNRTMGEFVEEHTRRDLFAASYERGSGSKANRLRAFWEVEGNHVVGKLLAALIAFGHESEAFKDKMALAGECSKIAARLSQMSPVPELDAITATLDERDFEAVAEHVRDAIAKNQPAGGLDRLHTFVMKFVRALCDERGVVVSRDKPLHSMFGEYVRRLREGGDIESEMTARILKSSISVLEAFNEVRNNRSLAHDNPILNYDESLLIFNHVTSTVRFIRSLEVQIKNRRRQQGLGAVDEGSIPF